MQRRIQPGWIIVGIAALVILLDQITKRWIEANLPVYESLAPFPALHNFFTLTHFTNTGAAFGLFRDQNILFVAIGVVVLLSIIIYSRYLPHDMKIVQVALGLQLGGALGNMIDRVRIGHVTDFIYFHFWPAFNIADSSIVVGVLLLAWVMLTYKEPGPESGEAHPELAERRG
ncbi:MAG: signal peptidase II [Anaerolineae bacterium]